MDIRVSIPVPIYSVEPFIERCARSLFNQSYQNLEFIFVNDATTDNSVEILKSVIEEFPGRKKDIRLINHPKNQGLSVARNTGVSNCTGDFICHVDSDDYLEPDAIERLVKCQLETNADIVSGDAIKHTVSGPEPFIEPTYKDRYEMLQNLSGQIEHHMIWGRLIRSSLYHDYSISAEKGCNVGEDWQVLVPLVYYSRIIAHLNHPIYHYNCENENSYMSQKKAGAGRNERIVKQDLRSLEIVKDFLRQRDDSLYRLIKKTGKAFAYPIMDDCILFHNKQLFFVIRDFLNRDETLYDRCKLRVMIDSNYFLYSQFYLLKRIKYQLLKR